MNMEEQLKKMEEELRLLQKKYFFLQETIEQKVDVRVKNQLAELEDIIVEKAVEKILIKITPINISSIPNDGIVAIDAIETNDAIDADTMESCSGLDMIQLECAGEMNGEMMAANVKTEPIDYDDDYEDDYNDHDYGDDNDNDNSPEPEVFEYNYDPEDLNTEPADTECENNTVENSVTSENETVTATDVGNHFLFQDVSQTEYQETQGDKEVEDDRRPLLTDMIEYYSPHSPDICDENNQEPTSRTPIVKLIRTPPKPSPTLQSGLKKKISVPILNKKSTLKFKCNECDLKFKSASFLRRHMIKHINARPFSCNLCPRSYKRLPHLHRHIKDSHETIKIPKRQSKKDLKEGKVKPPAKSEVSSEVASSKNNYDCSICGKHFSYPSHLKPHLLSHARKLARQGLAS